MSFYANNLNLLAKKDADLCAFLETVEIPDHFKVIPSQSGLPTLQIAGEPGSIRYLHSRKDPLSEAKHLLTHYSFKNEDATILFGFGLGYLAGEITTKQEEHHLLCIVERFPALFKIALEHMDLSEILAKDNVFFFLGDAAERLTLNFKPLHLKAISGSVNKLISPIFAALYGDHYRLLEQYLHNHISSLRLEFQHFLYNHKLYLTNLLDNIPCMPGAGTIHDLKDLIKGKPALVIAAGPSLDREMDILQSRAADCAMICVDTSLRPLLNKGITPDLVVTCDPLISNAKKMADLRDEQLADLPLLFRADAQPILIKRFRNHQWLVNSHLSFGRWLTESGRRVPAFPPYQSVAHLAFLTARVMGADPIILVGLDLAFPGDRDHAEDCTAPWKLEQCEDSLCWYPCTGGGQVRTLHSFIPMIRFLEQEIEKTAARCINVSAGGALVRGTTWMPLDQALKALKLKKPDNRSLRNLLYQIPRLEKPGLQTAFRRTLDWLIEETQALQAIYQAAECLQNRSGDSSPPGPQNTQPLQPLFDLHQQALKHKPFLDVLSDHFPNYLLSFHRIPQNGFPGIDPAAAASLSRQLPLFFEELGRILPLLLRHGQSALEGLT